MSSLYIELEPAGVEEVEAEGDTLQHIFDLCIPRKDLAKPKAQISTKYLQNRVKMFGPELWSSVENYSTTVDAAIQLSAYREQYIYKIIMKYSSNLMKEIYISN